MQEDSVYVLCDGVSHSRHLCVLFWGQFGYVEILNWVLRFEKALSVFVSQRVSHMLLIMVAYGRSEVTLDN